MSRETLVWLLLVGLTFATYLAGKLNYSGSGMMLLLMLSVFIKGHFVISDFMELRHVRLGWQLVMHGWLLFVTSLITLAYFIGIGAF